MDLGAFRQKLTEAAHLVDLVRDKDAIVCMDEGELDSLVATFDAFGVWVRSVAPELTAHVRATSEMALGKEALEVFDGLKAGRETLMGERLRRLATSTDDEAQGWDAFEPPGLLKRASRASVHWTRGWPFNRRRP